ncbi:MAG: hypothetical protein NTX75_16240 [Proteobacteria bacterium]|nr:hypothetical protein [Pseudomonadota bacterium]
MRTLKKTYIALLILATIFTFASICHADEGIGISIEKVESTEGIDRCKYCGRFIKNGNVHRDALAIVGKQLEEGLYARKIKFSGGKESDRYIHVYIYRFEERKGGNYSVEKPAGVGFHMHLFENNTLKQIFVFDEDQQALTENLFGIGKFFKRGGKWITAEALSKEGVEKGLDALVEDASQAIEKDSGIHTGDIPR